MPRQRLSLFTFIILPLVILPLAALLATGCGILTLPFDGTKAVAANLQNIKLNVSLVDERGRPLDDVTVVVTRKSLTADLFLPGTYNTLDKSDTPRIVSKVFTFESHGKCALIISFSKPGYTSHSDTYANVDEISANGLAAQGYYCINVAKSPNQTVTLSDDPAQRP